MEQRLQNSNKKKTPQSASQQRTNNSKRDSIKNARKRSQVTDVEKTVKREKIVVERTSQTSNNFTKETTAVISKNEKTIKKTQATAQVKQSSSSVESQSKPKDNKKDKSAKQKKTVSVDANWKRILSILPPSTKPKGGTAKAKAKEVKPSVSSLPMVISTATIEETTTTVATGYRRKVLALDCEMVGGDRGQSMLARVCIVNESGAIVYDKFVRPIGRIVDYRTKYSGVRPHNLLSSSAISFDQAQKEVAELIRGCIIVGHSVKNDFEALRIEHPPHLIRDTAKYHAFRSTSGHARKLKHLALERLQRVIQDGSKGHDPADDAKASMDLYLKHRKEWEESLSRRTVHATASFVKV